MKKSLIFLWLSFTAGIAYCQTAGTTDPSFNGNGKFYRDFGFQDNLQEVIVQADGKIVSGGTAINAAFSGQLLLVRQLQNGLLDSSFNDSGVVVVNNYTESYAYALSERADQKLLVAGSFADPSFSFSMLVIRLLSDGSPDPAFGNNGFSEINVSSADDFAYAMIEQPDQKILLAGTALDSLFRNQPVVVRLMEDGALDTSFADSGVARLPIIDLDNRLNSISLLADGRILVSGHYGKPLTTTGQFDFDLLVARLMPDGRLDTTFGAGGVVIDTVSTDYVDDLFGMGITTDNKVVVSGFTTNPDFSFDLITLQYDSTGVRDSSFGNNGLFRFDNDVQDVAYDLKVQQDGKIVIAGTSGGFFFDDRDFLLIRLNDDGTPDLSVQNTGVALTTVLNDFDEANALALQADGRIILAGKTFNGNNNDVALVRYYDPSLTGLGDVFASSPGVIRPNPAAAGQWISWNGAEAGTPVQLLDISGRLMEQTIGDTSFRLPAELVPGIYLLRQGSFFGRLVVE